MSLWKIFIATLAILMSMTGVASAKQVGMWYSTIYSKEKNYNWKGGFGIGTSAKFTADVSGDGKADAVTFDASSGDWYAALSDGSTFGTPSRWSAGFGIGTSRQFVADVNGDNKADFVTFDSGSGDWWAAISTGLSMNTQTRWIQGHGAGSQNQFLNDANGDGKADAVVYFDVTGAQGYWYVANSTGTNFGGYSLWIAGHGHGSQKQFLSDATGGGKSDAVVFFDITGALGKWYVAASTGSSFAAYSEWISGHGHGSNSQLLEDINNDGKSDAIAYFQTANGAYGLGSIWYRADSNGSGFSAYSPWKYLQGNNAERSSFKPANNLMIANVDGTGNKESIVYHEQYTDNSGAGYWKVLFDYPTPLHQNYWDAYDINYVPAGGKYDSGNTSVIDAHLTQMKNAGVDFIVLDLTNGVMTHPFITNRAKAVCSRVAQAGLKYVVAGGEVQYSGNTQDVETEAQQVLDNFVNDPVCGSAYYKPGGTPMLGMHFNSYAQKQDWLTLATHTASNSFTVKYVLGKLPVAPDNAPSSTGQGCGTFSSPSPPSTDFTNYLGWGLPYGTVGTGSMAVVEPGINNHRGFVIKRSQTGGDFYTQCGWDRVQANKSTIDTVIVNSYNEYAEETAVAPTDTSATTEPWQSQSYYWDIAVNQIAAFKN